MTETTAVAEYNPIAAGLAAVRQRYENVAWDLKTTKGNADARAARKELVTLRTSLEAKRVELKAPLLERTKLIDSEAKRITSEVLKIETPIDDQIKADEKRRDEERKAREAAEAARIADITARIQKIAAMPADYAGRSWAVIENAIADLQNAPTFDYMEFAEQAAVQAAVQAQAEKEAAAKKAAADPARPTDVQIVELLAGHYRVHPVEVIGWLRGIDFAALAPDLLSLAA